MSKTFLPDFAEVPPFPQLPENRPGLNKLTYHPGPYALIREALFRALDASPALAAWTHRRADDPGIALLEGAATVGDILGFYQDLYANEAFLSTAQWRESVASLVRLTGYRLSPALAGRGTFAAEIKGPPMISIPGGFPIKADLATAETPAEFETTATLTAYQHLSRFPVYLPRSHEATLLKGAVKFEITTVGGSANPARIAAAEIKKGDQLLLLPAAPMFDQSDGAFTKQKRLQIVKVAEVEVALGITTVTIDGRIGENLAAPVQAWRVGRSWRHFGWNAPDKIMTPVISGGVVTGSYIANADHTRHVGSMSDTHDCESSCSERLPLHVFALDQEVKDLTLGQTVIVDAWVRSGSEQWPLAVARRVKDTKSLTLSFGNLTGASSWLELDQDIAASKKFSPLADVRTMRLHEATSPELALKPLSRKASTLGQRPVCYFGTGAEAAALKDRRVWFEGPRGIAFERVCTDITALGEGVILSSLVSSLTALIGNTSFKTSHWQAAKMVQPAAKALAPAISVTPAISLAVAPLISAKLSTVQIHPQLLTGLLLGVEDYPKLWQLQFSGPLEGLTASDFPDQDPVVFVQGNLFDATEGRTQPLVPVGTGDARLAFQSFKLPKAPLTYTLSPDATPPEAPELAVYVGEVRWERVPSFYRRQPDEEIYIVREDEKGESWIQFGDGETGARLPSGLNNVQVIQRMGAGAYGPMKPGVLPSAGQRLDGLDKVRLLGVIGGGSSPETADKARFTAPGKTRSLGRLVGLQDYENEVLSLSGVTACTAAWDEWHGGMAVKLRILLESGREAEFAQIRDVIASLQRQRGPRRFPVVAEQAFDRWIWLHLHYASDPRRLRSDIEARLRTMLGLEGDDATARTGLFGVRRRRLGQREYASRVEGLCQQVPGVVWCRLAAWGRFAPGTDPEVAVIPSAATPPGPTLHCPPEQLLQLHPRHLQLTAVEAPASETAPV